MAKLNRMRKASLKSAACKPVTAEVNGKEPEGLAARLSARVSKLGIVTRSMVELETGLPDKDESSRSSMSSLSSYAGPSLRNRQGSQSLSTCPVRRSSRIMQEKGKVLVKEEPAEDVDSEEPERRPKVSKKAVNSESNCDFRQANLLSCQLRSSGPAIKAENTNHSCEQSPPKKRRRNELCILLESYPGKHEQEDPESTASNGDGETSLDISIESMSSSREDETSAPQPNAIYVAPRMSTPCPLPRPHSPCSPALSPSSAPSSPSKANSLLLKLLNEPVLDNGSPLLNQTLTLESFETESSTLSTEGPCSCPKGKRRTAVEALIQESERYISYPSTSSWRARSPFFRYNSRSRSIKASYSSSSSVTKPDDSLSTRRRDKLSTRVPSPSPEDVYCSKFKDSDGVPSDTESAIVDLAADAEVESAKTTDSLLFSFEQVPCQEPWYITYRRQDTNQLLPIQEHEIIPAPFLLPYEQSIEVILRRNGRGRGRGRRGGSRNLPITSRGTIGTRLQSQAAIPSSSSDAGASTSTKSYHSNEYMRNRPRRVRKPTRKAHLLSDVPRMSPRCHASTLAIMSATGISRRDSFCEDSNMEPLPSVSQVESEADLRIIARKLEDFLNASSPQSKTATANNVSALQMPKKRGRPRKRPLTPPVPEENTKDQAQDLTETLETFRDVINPTIEDDINTMVTDEVDIMQLLHSPWLPEEESKFCQELFSHRVAVDSETELARPESVLTCNTEESDMASTSTQSRSQSRGRFRRRRRNLTGWPKDKQRKRKMLYGSNDVADLSTLSPFNVQHIYLAEKPKLIEEEEETEAEVEDQQDDTSDSNENNPPPVLVAEAPLFEGVPDDSQESLEPDHLEPILSPVDRGFKEELKLDKLEPMILADDLPAIQEDHSKSTVIEKTSPLWLEKRILMRSLKRRESRRRVRHPPDRLEYWPMHHRLRRRNFF